MESLSYMDGAAWQPNSDFEGNKPIGLVPWFTWFSRFPETNCDFSDLGHMYRRAIAVVTA